MSRPRILAVVAVVIVLGIATFAATCFSSSHARERSLDDQTVKDSLTLIWYIDLYTIAHKALPKTLSEAVEFGHINMPFESGTGDPFEYVIKGESTYQLCTTFLMRSPEFDRTGSVVKYGDLMVGGPGIWVHDKGRRCIDRSVNIRER